MDEFKKMQELLRLQIETNKALYELVKVLSDPIVYKSETKPPRPLKLIKKQ